MIPTVTSRASASGEPVSDIHFYNCKKFLSTILAQLSGAYLQNSFVLSDVQFAKYYNWKMFSHFLTFKWEICIFLLLLIIPVSPAAKMLN